MTNLRIRRVVLVGLIVVLALVGLVVTYRQSALKVDIVAPASGRVISDVGRMFIAEVEVGGNRLKSGGKFCVSWNFGDGTPEIMGRGMKMIVHRFPGKRREQLFEVAARVTLPDGRAATATKLIMVAPKLEIPIPN